ncbi:SRPBCC family protein [Leucobacter chromiireducens]|uniref:SRPBCC family protein n=1 Tax=Leucobacter chromiireducens TaxID=283877 RepID=UPI000F632A75|nr:SRPBCC domain-containing protein [Leucobacter chromiireducens]
MTGVTAAGIEIDRTTTAQPAAVFAAFSEAESFARWFGGPDVEVPADRLDFTAEVGRTWAATMILPDGNTIDWEGRFVEVDAPHRFTFTLTDEPGPDSPQAPVSIGIMPADGGASIHLTQETPDFPHEQKAATLEGWQLFIDEVLSIAEAA